MQLPDANVRSSSYFVAQRQARCPQCGQLCRVISLTLPPNHETLVEDEWQTFDADAFIFHVANLPDTVSRLLLECFPEFRRSGSDGSSESCWVNHCPHCAGLFSDDELHCEPGGFMPSDPLDARAISLTHVRQAFSACAAGYALDTEFSSAMRVR
jgi:hypothetical protein